jgi:DNA primase
LDSDYLLNFLAQNYPIDTPEGKTKAALRFFEYIDVLQTDIQKESCKEQLSHAFNIPLEAVKKDFLNRNQITRTLPLSQSKNQQDTIPQIHVDAELRSLLAVIADTTQFEKIGSQISENDFENESAKDLFKALKQCYERGDMSVGNVLDHCNDRLQRIILDSFESGEFSENTAQAVVDGIELKKKDALRSRRDFLQNEISRIPPTKENQEILAKLIAEKMDLAKKLDKKD